MAAHPQLEKEDVQEIVKYILTLTEESTPILPLSGTINFDQHEKEDIFGIYALTATYTDKGNEGIVSITIPRIIRVNLMGHFEFVAYFLKKFVIFLKSRLQIQDHLLYYIEKLL